MRECAICGQIKPLTEFYRRPSAPDGHRLDCATCCRARGLRWRTEHRADLAARQRTYYRAHQTTQRTYLREYYQAHRQQLVSYQRAYRAAHREELRAAARLKYQQKREEYLAYNRTHREAHRDRIRANNNQRYARQRGAPVSDFTGSQWKAMKLAYGGRCAYCGCIPARLTMDHVIPLAKGGAHTASNIVPACMPCNNHKKLNAAPPRCVIPAHYPPHDALTNPPDSRTS